MRTPGAVWIVRVLAMVAASCGPAPLLAQTAQPFSVQLSALYNNVGGDFGQFLEITPGPGVELQFRWNPSLLSIGVGAQGTTHTDIDDDTFIMAGVFVEPRYVILVGSSDFAPYVAGRLALVTGDYPELDFTLTGRTINGGGGVLVRAGSRANVDIGVTAGTTNLSDEHGNDWGSATSVVARLGVAFGLGS